MTRKRSVSVLLLVSAALASCDSPSGPSPAGEAGAITVLAGDQQSGTVGADLGTSLSVKVTDAGGKPVKGVPVVFQVTAGGGALSAGSLPTDAAGVAQTRWTLGTVARDTQRVEARVNDPTTGAALATVRFRAVAQPDTPAALTKVAGDAQTGSVGAALVDSLAVRLTDRFGNAVAGRTVEFAATGGGGQVLPAAHATDSVGIARTQWRLGTRLDTAQTAAATFGALAPAAFTATARVDGTLTPAGGDGQTGPASHVLADSLAVVLRTGAGVPVRGATIVWTATGGSMVPATSRTDANGRATTSWLLGSAPGAFTATATVAGGAGTATFSATATVDPATIRAQAVSGDGLTAHAGSTLVWPPTILLGSFPPGTSTFYELPGLLVRWTVTSGGGAVSSDTSRTDSRGNAQTGWTLGPAVGTQTLRATWTYSSSTGAAASGTVDFHATATVAPRVEITQPTSGQSVRDSLAVDVTVSDAPTSVAASAAGRSVALAAAGGHYRGTLPLPGVAPGGYSLRVVARFSDGDSVVAGTTFVVAGPDSVPQGAIVAAAGDGQAADSGSTVTVTARAQGPTGTPKPGVAVAWSVVSGGGSVSPASSVTDAGGLATARWTLGGRSGGAQVLHASSPGLTPRDFTASLRVYGSLVKVAGDGQTLTNNHSLSDSLVVAVRDPAGAPIAGVTVTWSASESSVATPLQATTDASGRAAASLFAHVRYPANTHLVTTASVPGLPSAAFLTTVVGDSGTARLFPAGGDHGPAGGAVTPPLAVYVVDADGIAVRNAPVDWVVVDGGGVVSPAHTATDTTGNTGTTWTLGPVVGVQHLRVTTAHGATYLYAANAEATTPAPGSPASYSIVKGNGQTGAGGAALADSLALRITDHAGTVTPGVLVRWRLQ
ncbi:MAG: hypothetical protein JWM27_696 [Gemmatimonadetes bacterium]|nr:hypothetical protein [Gemmatimonadota bacterium]